jgi:catechol 2,3-dioxygenase-like lactoylglutathione lyase family enzyme
MTVPSRLSVATIGARDIPALRAFYERLGWTTNTKADDFAAFPLGGAVFCIYDLAHLAAEAGDAPVPDPVAFKGFSLSINVEERDQVATALAAAREAGATVLAEPVDRDWGGRSAYFADPEANAWEIAWVPGSEFDDRGALIWPF